MGNPSAWQRWFWRYAGGEHADEKGAKMPWLEAYPATVPSRLRYPKMSLGQLVDQAADRYPDVPAIHFDRATLTYAELREQVDRFAAALHQLGVAKGARVMIALPNCPEYVVAYFATVKLGAIVVQAGPMLGADELLYLGQKTSPRVAITLDLLGDRMEKLGNCAFVQHLVFVSLRAHFSATKQVGYWFKGRSRSYNPDNGDKRKVHDFSELMEKSPAYPPTAKINPGEDLAVLQPTGGTTGGLKAAKLTHKNILANATQLRTWANIQEGQETILAVLPLFHSFAMTTCMVAPIMSATTIVLHVRFEPEDVFAAIKQYAPTMFPMVPAIAVALNKHVAEMKHPPTIPPIRLCISGAAQLERKVKLDFEAWSGGTLIEGYGLSEASPVTHSNPADGRDRTGSIGLPMPDTEARIVDPAEGKRELSHGEVGELIIRAPQVMQGYYSEQEQTDLAIRSGWLYTGDLARMDEDGFFYIVDRKKDLVITSGFNVFPSRVEETLAKHPGVEEVAVVGKKDEDRGEIVVAIVVPTKGQEVTLKDLQMHCKHHLAPYEVPREVEFVESLPRNLLGKVLKYQVRSGLTDKKKAVGRKASPQPADAPAETTSTEANTTPSTQESA